MKNSVQGNTTWILTHRNTDRLVKSKCLFNQLCQMSDDCLQI